MPRKTPDPPHVEHGPIAAVAITVRGTLLAARLLAEIEGLELYAPARFLDAVPQTRATERHRPTEAERRRMTAYSEPVATLIARLFAGSRGLILVMAAGVAVRLIAPMLKDKRTDPAVVVVDDAGRFAISLLSGHLGGANRLAERVAGLVGACPVVTTASDGAGLPAADLLGRELGWRIEPGSALTTVAAALVNGERVGVYQDAGQHDWLDGAAPANLSIYTSLEALQAARPAAAILITDHVLELPTELQGRSAIYRPPSLVLGIGCSRGAGAAEIAALADATLAARRLSPLSVGAVASIDLKADEAGLLTFVRERGLPLTTYSAAELAATKGDWLPSAVVRAAVGAAGVAEPAALRLAGATRLLVPKQKSAHVTVAVARRVMTEAYDQPGTAPITNRLPLSSSTGEGAGG